MDATEHLQKHVWKHPRDYGGFSPDGDYLRRKFRAEFGSAIQRRWFN